MPATLNCLKPMLDYATPEMKFPMNVASSNLWLAEGILKKILASSPDTNASIRTTAATTIIKGGFAKNVLPVNACATVNFRLIPGDTVNKVIQYVKNTIDDANVDIRVVGFNTNAPDISPTDTDSFNNIRVAIKQVFPDTISVPYFVTGGTDSKHYAGLTKNLYRFTPSFKEDSEENHGANERIPAKNYEQYVKFFVQLIKNIQE